MTTIKKKENIFQKIIIQMYCLQIAVQEPKSLYRSRARRHFYGTENVIWVGFGPIGNTEKKYFWLIMSNF